MTALKIIVGILAIVVFACLLAGLEFFIVKSFESITHEHADEEPLN